MRVPCELNGPPEEKNARRECRREYQAPGFDSTEPKEREDRGRHAHIRSHEEQRRDGKTDP
jgi:hypothetical protein